jgi:hypothetical protein
MTQQKAIFIAALLAIYARPFLRAQTISATVPVHMVVTAESTKESMSPADMDKRDVIVKQGKNRLEVSGWIPARGDQAALQLVILIDDTCDSRLGTQLNDIRSFVTAQPATTAVAIGYMRNAIVTLVQDFTTDHDQAAKSIRLPLSTLSTQDSPYLSLISMLSRWPEGKVRREVIMITDGIDRLRGYAAGPGPAAFPGRGPSMGPPSSLAPPLTPGRATLPYISPDVDRASLASQKSGVIIHTIYAPGVGRADRNYYEANNGLNQISKLSDETGGESFSLTISPAVSFQPYFDRLQTILGNQYYLVFQAQPGKKAGLQRINLDTEVPNIEFAAADNVWVPAPTGSTK